jgi:hypothetical protein
VHSYIETPIGEKIIVTFVAYLLKLLDDPGAMFFDGDTTFKGLKASHCILTGSGPTLADLAKAWLMGSRLGSRNRQNAVG